MKETRGLVFDQDKLGPDRRPSEDFFDLSAKTLGTQGVIHAPYLLYSCSGVGGGQNGGCQCMGRSTCPH